MVVLWGSNARETHPIFFHHVIQAKRRGAKLFVVDPRRTSTARFADAWLRPGGRHRHRPGQHRGPGDHLRRTGEPTVSSTGPPSASTSSPPAVEPWTLRAGRGGDRRSRRTDPGPGPRLRPGGPGPALLDARHHRAPQRRRQRAVAHQPGAVVRARRPLRRRSQPAAGAEQRAGRRRHGRHPQPPARFRRHPRSTEVRAPLRRRLGDARSQPTVRLAPDPDVRGHGAGAISGRCTCIGENPAQSEADVAHAITLLEGLDHLVVQDIFLDQDGGVGRRRAAGQRGVVRERRAR